MAVLRHHGSCGWHGMDGLSVDPGWSGLERCRSGWSPAPANILSYAFFTPTES